MIVTNIQKIFESAGLENPRPTDKALEEMGLTRKRFTQLLENTHKSPITVAELSAIKGWIAKIRELDPEQIIGEFEPESDLAESLGLTK
jgi:hypothetical protein